MNNLLPAVLFHGTTMHAWQAIRASDRTHGRLYLTDDAAIADYHAAPQR